MQATKPERIILFGVVPVACAIVGVVGTVTASRAFRSNQRGDAIVRASNLSAAEKMKLLELANKNDEQFYDFIRTWLFLLVVPIGAIAYAVADWTRSR